MKKNTRALKNRAFTLVETMVAISILMIAILGPLSIATSALRNSLFARDQISSFYLAQEGIEYVRYIRDDNYLAAAQGESHEWDEGLDACKGARGCVLDTLAWFEGDGDVLQACSSDDCADSDKKMLVNSDGYYNYQAGEPTVFTRILKVEDVSANQMKVTSRVILTRGLTTREFVLTENVFKIYPL